jgi:hypothetical protein
MPQRPRRRQRSCRVGDHGPARRGRWSSSSARASRERSRRDRERRQRRWRQRRRCHRRALGDLASREVRRRRSHLREEPLRADRVHPSPQRGPARRGRRADDGPGARPSPHIGGCRVLDPEQGHRPRHRRRRVESPAQHLARYYHQDRAAPARVAPHRDRNHLGRTASREGSALLSLAQAVADDPELLPWWMAGAPAARARPGAHAVHVGYRRLPGLDVQPARDDLRSCSVCLDSFHPGRRSTTRAGAANAPLVTYLSVSDAPMPPFRRLIYTIAG